MLGFFLFGRERLRSYSVHEKPTPVADRAARAEELEFVRDGFDFSAFLAPPVWFMNQKIWLGLAAYAGAVAVIVALSHLFELPPYWPVLGIGVLHLIVGWEADELHRSQLAQRGWTTLGHVTGTSALDCERRFYEQWLPTMPVKRQEAPQSTSVPIAGTVKTSGVLGNIFAPLKRGG